MKKRFILLFLALLCLSTAIPVLALSDDDDSTESTTTATSDEISAMSTALDSLQLFTLGTGLGEYTSTDDAITSDSISKLVTKVEALESSTDPDSATVAAATEEIAAARAALELNLPQAGTYLRIKSRQASTYVSSQEYSSGGSALVEDADETTIFYYDGSSLVSVATGYYPTSATTNGVTFTEIASDPVTVDFTAVYSPATSSTLQVGYYAVHFNGSYTLSVTASIYNTNCQSSYKTEGGYFINFTLEEVSADDAITITQNSAGYATIYSPVEISVPDGATPYVVSIDSNGDPQWTELSITTIPANSGVVLKYSSDTESAAATASDDDSDDEEIEYMNGQVAAATATGSEYVLSVDDDGNVTFTQATAGDELAGFTAYATAETSYTADDVKTAWSELIGDYTVGDALGEYSATISGSDDYTDYASLLAAVEELISSEDASASDYATMLTTLGSITITFTINPVETGMFIRLQGTSDYYLGSTNTQNSERIDMVEEADEGTIFYYDGSYLINYETGYYIVCTTTSSPYRAGYNGVSTPNAPFSFGTSSSYGSAGQYSVSFVYNGTTRYLYGANTTYTDYGSSINLDGYMWTITEITELPVTTDEAGYATLYAPVALTVPDGVTLYSVDITSASNVTYELSEALSVTTLPANTAVLVKGTASETYTFTIAESSDETVTTSMGGQVAAAYATGYEYVLSDDATELTFTSTTSETELGGFSAYAVLNDGIDWVALQEALDSYDAASIGEDLGEYLPEDYTYAEISALYETIAAYTYGDASLDADAVNENVSTLATALESLTINTPTAGMFLRISPQASGYYLGADNSESSTSRAEYISDGTTAETIFYYDGTYLLNYSNGYYLCNNSNYLGYNGIQSSGAVFTFSEGLATGQYFVKFGSRYLYGGSSATYTNAGNSVGSDTGYDFNLYEVTSLPVETDEAGYATLYAPVALTVPEGVTVQSVVVSNYAGSSFTATDLEEQTTIPANTAVLIMGTANTTYEFEITTSDATVETAMSGQIATVYASGGEYILDYDEDNSTAAFTLATADETELQGFTAYTTYDDGIDWDALEEYVEYLEDRTIGTAYGEYTSEQGYTETEKDSILTLANSYDPTGDPDSAAVNLTISTLAELCEGLSINLPEDGTFLRIRSKATNTWANYYLSSEESDSVSGRAAFVSSGTSANTIFYYTDGTLLAYETGYYIANVGSGSAAPGYGGIASGLAIEFVEATDGTAGQYNININGNSNRFFCNNAAYSDAGSFSTGVTSDTYYRYNFMLYDVDELPVTTNENGYTTFYAPVAVSLPSSGAPTLQEAIISSRTNDGDATSETSDIEATVIPASTGVVVKGDASTTYTFTITDEEGTLTTTMGGQIATALQSGTQFAIVDSLTELTFALNDTIWGFKAYATYQPSLVLDSLTGVYGDDGSTVSFTIAANHAQVMPWDWQERYLDIWDEPAGYLSKHSSKKGSVVDSLFTYWTSFGAVDSLADTTPYLILSCGVYNNMSLSYLWPNPDDVTKADSVLVARSGRLPNGTYCPYYLITADGWHITDYTITYRGLTEVEDSMKIDTTWTYTTTTDTTWTYTDSDTTYTITTDSSLVAVYDTTTVYYSVSATCYMYFGDRDTCKYIIPGLSDCDTTITVSGEEQQIVAFTVETDNSNTSDGVLIAEMTVNIAKDADYETHVNLFKTNLYNSDGTGTFGDFQPYRHPALGGYGTNLVAFAEKAGDYDVVLGDGDGDVSLIYRTSSDGGVEWSADDTLGVGSSTQAYGNPAIIANFGSENSDASVEGSNEVLLLASKWVADDTVALRTVMYRSEDNGVTWGEEVDITDVIDSLVGGGDTIYVAAGRLMQSRLHKVSDYYRVYAAVRVTDGDYIYNYVICTDDFGETWELLNSDPAIAMDYSYGIGEPKVEELPTGSLVVSSSTKDGRQVNVYTFMNNITYDEESGTYKVAYPDTLAGYWSSEAASNSSNDGTEAELASNSDLIIVPAVKLGETEEENDTTFLALQSLSPYESSISSGTPAELRIYYKDLASLNGYYTGSRYAADWDGYHRVSKIASGGASMVINADKEVAYIFEEENFGPKSDYTIVYHGYSLEEITDGAYTYNDDYVWGTNSGFDLSEADTYLDEEMDDYSTTGKYVGQLGDLTDLQAAYEAYLALSSSGEDDSEEDDSDDSESSSGLGYLEYYEYFHWVLQHLGADNLIGLSDTMYYVIHSSYDVGSGDDYTLNLTYNLYSDGDTLSVNDDALAETSGGRTMYQEPELWRVIDAAGEDETAFSKFRLYNVGRKAYLATTGESSSQIEFTDDSLCAGVWYIETREARSGKSTLICSSSSEERASIFYANDNRSPFVWGKYVSQTQWYIEPITMDSINHKADGATKGRLELAADTALMVKRGYRIYERTALEKALEAYQAAETITTAETDTLYAAIFDFYRNSIPTNRFYRIKGSVSGKHIINGTSGGRVAMGSVSSEDNSDANYIGAIYYYGSDSTMVNYYDGYAIQNATRAYKYSNYTEKTMNASRMEWRGQNDRSFDLFELYDLDNSRWWYDNISKLDRNSVKAEDSTVWTIEEVEKIPVKISSDAKYATLICPNALLVPEGVEAYYGAVNWTDSVFAITDTISAGEVIPQGVGVILHLTGDASSSSYYDFVVSNDSTTVTCDLKGQVYTHTLDTSYKYYVLAYKNDSVDFYLANTTSTSTSAGSKAYLQVSESLGSSIAFAKLKTVVDEVTGVEELILVPIEDEDDEPYYDLQGRIVLNPQKGIYIHKGRKVYVK